MDGLGSEEGRGIEGALARLCPSPVPEHLMARLTAAAPGSAQGRTATPVPGGHRAAPRRCTPRLRVWLATAAGAAALLAVFISHPAPPGPVGVAAGQGPAAAVPESPVFLPVAATRRIVEVRPAFYVQRPDEAPTRIAEVLWVEEVTAVGAEADETIQLMRTGKSYLPVEGQYH